MRRHHTGGKLTPIGCVLTVAVAVACTRTPTSVDAAPPSGPNSALPATVAFAGIDFDVRCAPVAEALTDIDLPHHGQPKLRAITGLWDHQAIAVLANQPKGCGVWTLAVARRLSDTTREAIETEVADGVEHFGVTASPVPKDP